MIETFDFTDIIAADWARLSEKPEALAEAFYARLFAMAPETAEMFRGVDMRAQGGKLAAALDLVLKHAKHLDRIEPTLKDLGRRHAAWGVEGEHYDIVGAALIATFADRLKDEFDDVHVTAWITAYGAVAAAMQRGAVA